MVRHIVLIKVAEGITNSEIDFVFERLESLKTEIPGIISFDAGINNSPENISRGYTHVFMMDFADVHSRDSYLPHPEHEKVKLDLFKILTIGEDRALVIDFEF